MWADSNSNSNAEILKSGCFFNTFKIGVLLVSHCQQALLGESWFLAGMNFVNLSPSSFEAITLFLCGFSSIMPNQEVSLCHVSKDGKTLTCYESKANYLCW